MTEPTQEQIEAAAKAIMAEEVRLFNRWCGEDRRFELYAKAALKAAAALTPEKRREE